jgi:hypothetical protein
MTSNPKVRRPSDKVLHELGAKDIPWDVDKHLAGCLNAYNQYSSYGTAVYFALEAIAGIGREGMQMAESKELPQELKDPEWGLAPTQGIPVPWLWVRTLTEAWERYKAGDEGLGKAFGQEGGQGKPPISKKLDTLLDQRAIATWIWRKVQKEKAAGRRFRIEDAIGEAADSFDLSEDRIRTIWKYHGRHVKRSPRKAGTSK